MNFLPFAPKLYMYTEIPLDRYMPVFTDKKSNGISVPIKSLEMDQYYEIHPHVEAVGQTDRQTDRQTDTIATHSSALNKTRKLQEIKHRKLNVAKCNLGKVNLETMLGSGLLLGSNTNITIT